MKKIISLAIVCVMMLGMLSMVSFADATATEIYSYSDGIENWGNETVFLICADNIKWDDGKNYRWELTITDGTTTKTVTKVPSSGQNWGENGGLYRFTTCIGVEGNQFVPAKDGEYTITAKIYNKTGTELLYTATTTEGETWKGFGDSFLNDGPVKHDAMAKDAITIVPKFGAWENWTGSPNKGDKAAATQLLVGITGELGDPMLDDETYLWEVKITAGGTTKTLITKPGTHASAYNLYRFETCIGVEGNQFVPVAGTDYTVQITVYDAEGYVVAKSEAVSGFKVPDNLVPVETTPLQGEVPVIPTPSTPKPPVTGDNAVFAIVFATVAILGMAVVVTKKVNA